MLVPPQQQVAPSPSLLLKGRGMITEIPLQERASPPNPSPNGEGSNRRDVHVANHQHLTPITHHPSLAETLCDICMPEAFCGFETVRNNALLNLWVLWEKKLSSELFVCHLIEWVRSFSHRKTQKNRIHRGQKNSGPSPGPSPEGKGSNHRDTHVRWM